MERPDLDSILQGIARLPSNQLSKDFEHVAIYAKALEDQARSATQPSDASIASAYPDCRPGFYLSSRAWYAASLPNRNDIEFTMMVGQYATTGGCAYEFEIAWYALGGGRTTARLGIFADSFGALHDPLVRPAIDALAALDHPSPDEVIAVLVAHGFADLTAYTNPDAAPPVDEDPRDARIRELEGAVADLQRRAGARS